MSKLYKPYSFAIITFLVSVLAVAGWFYYQKTQTTQIILPNARWERIYFKSINEATNLTGLIELRKANLRNGDIEIRVWRITTSLEGVILRRTNNQWSARHITESYDDIGKVEMKELNLPKSGWESFWKQIVDKEILTLRDSSVIGCGEGGIDATSYVVEINQNKTYRTYKLSADYSGGKCREANQMEEIGNIIGEEFHSGIEQCQRVEWFACTKARKLNKQNNQ